MNKRTKIIIISIVLAVLLALSINSILTLKKTRTTDSYDWQNDGILLMQHETEGFYGCFGCSGPGEGAALCIDPAPVMKLRDETEARHCGNQFNVVEE